MNLKSFFTRNNTLKILAVYSIFGSVVRGESTIESVTWIGKPQEQLLRVRCSLNEPIKVIRFCMGLTYEIDVIDNARRAFSIDRYYPVKPGVSCDTLESEVKKRGGRAEVDTVVLSDEEGKANSSPLPDSCSGWYEYRGAERKATGKISFKCSPQDVSEVSVTVGVGLGSCSPKNDSKQYPYALVCPAPDRDQVKASTCLERAKDENYVINLDLVRKAHLGLVHATPQPAPANVNHPVSASGGGAPNSVFGQK